jgi:hypothetical protein
MCILQISAKTVHYSCTPMRVLYQEYLLYIGYIQYMYYYRDMAIQPTLLSEVTSGHPSKE